MPAAKPMQKARRSKLLVVDASIMRAAGGEDATDPVPSRARDTLKTILDVCHRVCLSSEINEEWKRNRSRYAYRWTTQMYGRGKVIPLKTSSDADLLTRIGSTANVTTAQVKAVEKDFHLIMAALSTDDRVILSKDDQMAGAMRNACSNTTSGAVKRIADILWINPITDHTAICNWLRELGPPQPHWPLGSTPSLSQPATRSRRKASPRGNP